MKYIAPNLVLTAFNCPHCGAFAKQNKFHSTKFLDRTITDFPIETTVCDNCKNYAIWNEKKMVYPDLNLAPLPNPDLSDDILSLYNEAASITTRSPRGAAALLRLAIQKLCIHLGEKGKDINNDIASLVTKGLPVKIQKSLDAVRVIGNNAVHPGQIDVDSGDVVANLFHLINIIAEYAITIPKNIDKIYDTLPESNKDAIIERDSK